MFTLIFTMRFFGNKLRGNSVRYDSHTNNNDIYISHLLLCFAQHQIWFTGIMKGHKHHIYTMIM